MGRDAEAHAALAARYRAQHAAAEAQRRDAARAKVLLEQHLTALPSDHPDRLDHEAYLEGSGALSLVTDPPGAEVLLHRYVGEPRRLVTIFERSLGQTPLNAVELPMGSYLAVLGKDGYRDVRYPGHISRNRDWRGEVRLYGDDEIGWE